MIQVPRPLFHEPYSAEREWQTAEDMSEPDQPYENVGYPSVPEETYENLRYERRKPLKRRPGACIPCQQAKTRCNGETPCLGCTSKRIKPICIYKPQRSASRQEAGNESPWSNASQRSHSPGFESQTVDRERHHHQGPPLPFEDCHLFGPHCLARSIDQFKLLSAVDLSPRPWSITYCTGQETFDVATQGPINRDQGTVPSAPSHYSVTATQLLSRELLPLMPPYLVKLFERVVETQHTIQEGKLVEAWFEMGRLTREAEAHQLHIRQSQSKRQYKAFELEYRRRIWWMIIELEVQIATHIGRGISGLLEHGIDRPMLENVESDLAVLEKSRIDFRQYALDILDSLSRLDTGSEDVGDYESLLTLARLDALQRLIDSLPVYPAFSDEMPAKAVAVADHHIEVYAFRLMLCCLLARSSQKKLWNSSDKVAQAAPPPPEKPKRGPGRRLGKQQHVYDFQQNILDSARNIVTKFKDISAMEAQEQTCNWLRCFDAYTAVSILAIAALRRETKEQNDFRLIGDGQQLFASLARRNHHCRFADVASRRISDLWSDTQKLPLPPVRKAPNISSKTDQVARPTATPYQLPDTEATLDEVSLPSSRKKRKNRATEDLRSSEAKRLRVETDRTLDTAQAAQAASRTRVQRQTSSGQEMGHHYLVLNTPFTFPPSESPNQLSPYSESLPQSSFTSYEDESANVAYYAQHWDHTGTYFPYNPGWWHPPLIEPQIPFYHPEYWDWNGFTQQQAYNPSYTG